MFNIIPPAIIKPCYGQFIINWWLWHHYKAPFTVYSPCYGQFIINKWLWSPYSAPFTVYSPWFGQFYHHSGALTCSYENVCPYQLRHYQFIIARRQQHLIGCTLHLTLLWREDAQE